MLEAWMLVYSLTGNIQKIYISKFSDDQVKSHMTSRKGGNLCEAVW